MPKHSIKKTTAWHWIPPITTAGYKITITSGTTVTDITSLLSYFKFEDGKNGEIGQFKIDFYDPTNDIINIISNMDTVSLYLDYSSTATTLRFKGYIEGIDPTDYIITLTGRTNSLRLNDNTVTQSYTNECSVILKDLLTKYAPWVEQTGIQTTTVSLEVTWINTPFWDCVAELHDASGYDAYLNCEDIFFFYDSGSVINDEEAIVHGINLFETSKFVADVQQVKNRVIVYGAIIDGIQVLYTTDDSTSQGEYGIREHVVNNTNIASYTQARQYGDYILDKLKDPPVIGTVRGLLLASIQPAQKIYLSDPDNGVQPDSYEVISYIHEMNDEEGFTTSVKVNKEGDRFSLIFSQLISNQSKTTDNSLNPYEMEHSYNHFFDLDSGSHTNTEITNGVLKPTAAAGTWISEPFTLPDSSNITYAYPIMVCEKPTGITLSLSANDGVYYQTVSNKELLTFSSAIGPTLVIKVVFSDANSNIDSLSILCK